MCQSNVITVDDLPPALRSAADDGWIRIRLGANMAECEKSVIRDTLTHVGGNKSKAAETLEISRKTLIRKIDEYGLDEELQQ